MATLICYKHFVRIGRDERGCIRRHFQPQSSPRSRKDLKGLIVYL